MSSSVKPRLAGRQPSHRGGVLRVTTRRRAGGPAASAGSHRTRDTTGEDMRQSIGRGAANRAFYPASSQRRHVDQGRLSSGLCSR